MPDDTAPLIPPEDSAIATLQSMGLLVQPGQSAVAAPGLGLMDPNADSGAGIIPDALLRPADDGTSAPAAVVPSTQEVAGGGPVLPASLPQHGNGPGPVGIIPQGLVRPGEAAAVNAAPALNAAHGPSYLPSPTPAGPGVSIPQPDLQLEDADAQAMAADRRALESKAAAGQAASDAATDRNQRLFQIDSTELRDQDRVLSTHTALRELADAKASLETHQWMNKIDDMIRKEPDPGRMFTGEGGSMRRSMWFAAIVGQAIANRAHPERANMAMQMLMHEIDQDVALQKDQQNKLLANAKMHLEQTNAEHAQTRADLADDRSQKLLRLGTVARVLRDQAMLPGPMDQRAAKLAAAAQIDQQMAEEAHGYLKEARETRYKDLDRQKDFALAGIKERAAMERTQYEQGQQNYRQVQQQKFEVGPEKEAYQARDEVRKAALAKQEAVDKAGAEMRAKQAPLNTDLGVTAIDPKTHQPVPLILNDQDRQKAGEIVHVGNEEWGALSRLDKQLATMGPTDFVAGNPKFDAALAEANAIRAKSLHGGGRVSESFVKLAQEAETGAKGSWQGRALQDVRGQLDQVREVVKQRMREMPQAVADEVKPFTRNNEEIKWQPQELQGQEAPTPDATDIKAAYGVSKPDDITRPISVKEFDEVEQGKRRAPPMSPTGDQAVKDAVKAFGYTGDIKAGRLLPESIESLAKAAEDRIRKEGHASAFDADKAPIPEGEREDVIHMINLAKERALNKSNEGLHDTVKDLLTKPGHQTGLYNFDYFLEQAEKVGGFDVKDPDTKDSLKREFDKLHKGDAIDYDAVDALLKETDKRFN